MSALRSLQTSFMDYVLHGNQAVAGHIARQVGPNIETRLGIYSDAYRLRLIECLQEDFPQLHRYLGDEQFEALCRAYIDVTPSHFTSLRDYGEALPHFASEQAPFARLPDIAELALFERTLRFAFDAAGSRVLAAADMAALAPDQWPEVRFVCVPSARLLTLRYNTVEVYKQLEAELPTSPARLLDKPVTWLIWRKPDMMSWYRSLREDEAAVLLQLMRGATFAELGEAACEGCPEDEAPLRVAQWLQGWIQEQLLAELRVDPHGLVSDEG